MLTGFVSGFRFQAGALRKHADTYFSLLSAPFFTLIFLSIIDYSGRAEFMPSAVLAPSMMTLWTAALMFSGEMISEDRENGRLEWLVATPASFPLLVFGRLCACMIVSLPALLLSILVAGAFFDRWITIHHPWLFALATLLTAVGTAATATALSALFVLTSGARIVHNMLSFPMFLVGGVIIPAASLPAGLTAISRMIYLSWGADLLRDSLKSESVRAPLPRLGMVVLLAGVGLAFGMASIARFLRRGRELGALSKI